jgi:hypothetical protein
MQRLNTTTQVSREAFSRPNAAARGKAAGAFALALPYAVYINGVLSGHFDDIRDAIASARIAKCERPITEVTVMDAATGKMMIEVEA